MSQRKEIKNENVEPLTQLTGQMQKDRTLVDRAQELLKGLEGLWGWVGRAGVSSGPS